MWIPRAAPWEQERFLGFHNNTHLYLLVLQKLIMFSPKLLVDKGANSQGLGRAERDKVLGFPGFGTGSRERRKEI